MKKLLVLGINQKVHSTLRIVEELEKAKIPYDFIKWGSLFFLNGRLWSGSKPVRIKDYGAVAYDVPNYCVNQGKTTERLSFDLKNELSIFLKKLKEAGVCAMNRDFLLDYAFYNKFTQSEIFSRKKISAIPTLHLTDNKYEKTMEALRQALFKFPLVVKESNGGLGRKVWKIETEKALRDFLSARRSTNLIFQPFIKNTGDFRVLIVGGRSMGIMKRSAQRGEWRNNFALGGRVSAYRDPAMEKFAETACRRMGMDYAGVDILKTRQGYLVIEVNAFACFEGFEKVYPRKNIGKKIINYLISKA